MFDSVSEAESGLIGSADLRLIRATLGRLDASVSDGVRIDQLRLLEEIKAATAAAQAKVTAGFVVSQRAEQAAKGVPAGSGEGFQRRWGWRCECRRIRPPVTPVRRSS